MNRERLINELLDKKVIRIGESIDYKRFKQIHSDGYSHISEYDFAEMLGINNGNFNNVKNKGQKAVILKELIPMYEEKLAHEISEDVLKKLEAGQKINYEQFCTLRKFYSAIYGEISESRFGRYLELNTDALSNLRKGNRVSILKSKFDAETIIDALIKEGIAVPGEKIDYNKFLAMFEQASNNHPSIAHFSQYAFAKLLGIRKSNFSSLKLKGTNSQILKEHMQKNKKTYGVSDEERISIVQQLITDRNAKPYEMCDYERFRQLYQGYEHISEYKFAHILDMASNSFCQVKHWGKQARILKDCLDKEQIVTELILSGKLRLGEEIDYIRFCELYKDYQHLGVYLFGDIIEINEGNIERLKANPGSTIAVFKSRMKRDEVQKDKSINFREQAKSYVEGLFETGKIYVGQEIDYKSFQEIYFGCSSIHEHEFAALLGISYFKYQSIRWAGTKTYIHDCRVQEAIKLIGKIERERYFSKEEIEDICNEYGITMEDFIMHFVYSGNFRYNSNPEGYMDILEKSNRIYIGRTRMSNEFFEKIYPTILEPIKRLVGVMCKKYEMIRHMEDFESEAIMYVVQNCGDIEKNFSDCSDNQTLVNMIISRLKLFLNEKMISHLKISKKNISTSSFYTRRENQEYIIPDNNSTEERALQSVMDESTESKIMCELIRRFENGMDKIELLESIQTDFGISKEALLELLSKRVEIRRKNREDTDVSIE